MIGRPLSPVSVMGARRRGRRRGLLVGAAVGATVASRGSNNAAQEEPAEPSMASGGDDQMAQLEKLGQLKAEGILTEEEFTAKKKQILGL